MGNFFECPEESCWLLLSNSLPSLSFPLFYFFPQDGPEAGQTVKVSAFFYYAAYQLIRSNYMNE